MRKGIATLIKDLKSIKGIDEITMTTNGVSLKKMIPKLRDAGLDRLNISLDSLRPERLQELTGADIFSKVMDTVEHIVENKIWPVKINIVAIRGFNDDEVLDFAELAAKIDVQARFIEMMPTAQNRMWENRTCIPVTEIEKKIRQRYELEPVQGGSSSGPAKVYKIKNGAGEIGFISAISNHFCDTCNRLRLTAEGKLRSCLFSDYEVDLSDGFKRGETDGWFVDKLKESLKAKPERHKLDTDSKPPCIKPMISIGG